MLVAVIDQSDRHLHVLLLEDRVALAVGNQTRCAAPTAPRRTARRPRLEKRRVNRQSTLAVRRPGGKRQKFEGWPRSCDPLNRKIGRMPAFSSAVLPGFERVKSLQSNGKREFERHRDYSGRSTDCRWVFPPGFITIRLQPQMKKYRCLWCMSTANHNILYFVHICGHWLPKHGHSACGKLKQPCRTRVSGPRIAQNPVQTRLPQHAKRSHLLETIPQSGAPASRRNGAKDRPSCANCGELGR